MNNNKHSQNQVANIDSNQVCNKEEKENQSQDRTATNKKNRHIRCEKSIIKAEKKILA
jgi:hypothetical protein